MLPWGSFTSGEVSQAHQGGKQFSVHANDSQNESFVQFWKTILAPLTSVPVAGLPSLCPAVWVSAILNLVSAACSPGLWMLSPP